MAVDSPFDEAHTLDGEPTEIAARPGLSVADMIYCHTTKRTALVSWHNRNTGRMGLDWNILNRGCPHCGKP